MAPRWTEEEWDELFRLFPPVEGQRPGLAACEPLARKFNRTPDGIQWMWDDAAHYRSGKPKGTASQRLKDYLGRRR